MVYLLFNRGLDVSDGKRGGMNRAAVSEATVCLLIKQCEEA